MKNDERGPFSRIRWFCKDGKILPPDKVGCAKHGGGVQHGELSERAISIRLAGYPIGTMYADFTDNDIQSTISSTKSLAAMLLERYLIIKDEGWIFRKALFYRGALQTEDEAVGAERLLTSLLNQSSKENTQSYFLIREAARLLALDKDSALLNEVRAEATQIANLNFGFVPLRNKLHTFPEPIDAMRIRNFAIGVPKRDKVLVQRINDLALKLERVFSPTSLILQGRILINVLPPSDLANEINKALKTLSNSSSLTIDQFWALSDIIYYVRKYFNEFNSPTIKRQILIFSLQAERTLFKKWSEVQNSGELKSRYDNLQFLLPILQAGYGSGLLTERTYKAAAATVNSISSNQQIKLGVYLRELRYLTRVSEWASTEVSSQIYEGLALMREIEPEVDSFIGDRLHSSLLLAFSQVLDKLLNEGSHFAGLNHQIAERLFAGGVRALNPGFAKGILTFYRENNDSSNLANSIIIADNSIASLPPVAGVLTMREGNSLSHIQILARNLGIPNAVVGEEALANLQRFVGQEVVLAVSPSGRVEIQPYSAKWNTYFQKGALNKGTIIEADLDRLDLDETSPIKLGDLDSRDSGKTVGPKAARLGELKKLFPDLVSDGIAIPFGQFYQMLEHQTFGEDSLFTWMKSKYSFLAKLSPDSERLKVEKRSFLSAVRSEIATSNFEPDFLEDLKKLFEKHLGPINQTAVYVRSDTNVEDLPGFSGAGLNLTVPNVIGFENILKAIKNVWASPFEERAFDWRQGKMKSPEHVYSSVLLQKTVANDISGVVVTSDLETGDMDYFTVAVNYGVGGAVNNQQSEQLVIGRKNGEIRLLAESAAHTQQVPVASGGLTTTGVPKSQRLLNDENILSLTNLVERVEKKYTKLKDSQGMKVPADIEFGFVKNKLFLFQIRPFLESLTAKQNRYLLEMDTAYKENYQKLLNLKGTLREVEIR